MHFCRRPPAGQGRKRTRPEPPFLPWEFPMSGEAHLGALVVRSAETRPPGMWLGPPFPPAAGTFGGDSNGGLDPRDPPGGYGLGPPFGQGGVVSGVLLRGETGGAT